MTTIAITGASGFIGRPTTALVARSGYRVRTLARGAVRDLPPGVEAIQGDITDPAKLRELLAGCDLGIHLAGFAHSRVRPDQRAEVRRVNVEGTRIFLEAARAVGVKRVAVFSSALVYAGEHGDDLREEAPLSRDGDYAASKIEIEELARSYANPEVVVIRPSLVYGPHVRANLLRMLRAIDRGFYFNIGSDSPMRSFASVFTVGRAALHLLERGSRGTYNVADECPQQLEVFADDLARRMGRRRARRMPYWVASMLANLGTAGSAIGVPVPLDRDGLAKLVQPLWLNIDKLRATGFTWDRNDKELALQQMVESYLADSRSGQ